MSYCPECGKHHELTTAGCGAVRKVVGLNPWTGTAGPPKPRDRVRELEGQLSEIRRRVEALEEWKRSNILAFERAVRGIAPDTEEE